MVFSSVISLFAFIPAVYVIYYLIPRRYALVFLCLMNLVFYGWGGPAYLVLMIVSIAANYTAAMLIERLRYKKFILISAVVLNIGMLGYYKFAGLMVGTVGGLSSMLFGPESALTSFAGVFDAPALPIGISFYTFQAMAYVIDVYRGTSPAEPSILKFGTFIALFPQLIAGPIVLYRDVADQMGKREFYIDRIADGLKTFICGLSKKLLLSNPLEQAWSVFAEAPGQNGVLGAWIGLITYAFHIYFDFSGYSDMAVGLGKMLGFKFPDNFNYPYISKSITEFWRRWHITLSSWFRDYLYFPLGGSRRSPSRNMLNLFVVWLLTGLWHGASWNFALWGLYFAVLLAFERLFLNKFFDKIRLPGAVRILYTFGLVVVGWGLFAITDINLIGAYIAEMFGKHTSATGLLSGVALVKSVAYIPTLLLCGIMATPLPKKIWRAITETDGRQWRFTPPVEAVGVFTLFVLCVAATTAQGYDPFIYFRF